MFRRKKEKNVEMYCRNLNRGIASARMYGSIMILSSFLFGYLRVLVVRHLVVDNQPSTLTVTISPTGLNGNKTSPVPPPPPPPPPPAVTLPEENEDRDKR